MTKDTESSMSWQMKTAIGAFIFFFIAVLILIGFYIGMEQATKAQCEAVGGTVVNSDTCMAPGAVLFQN